jgi:urease accessory protein
MDNAALLRLLTWLSPAFPTGGFAYSHGLEWSVEAGDVTDESSLTEWLKDLLNHGALWGDILLLRHAYRGEDVTELGTALCASAERRLETLAQGRAFALAAVPWGTVFQDDLPLPYPVAVGILAAARNVGEDDAVLAFLHAGVANLVSAAVRLIPLGQTAGLRVQAALEPDIIATTAAAKTATLDELGTVSWRSDIASMRHETQYTRLFRT